MLVALGALASDQSCATTLTLHCLNQFLDYCATNPNATITYTHSPMKLLVQSDASYLTASRGRSHAGGIFFLGDAHHPERFPSNAPFHCEASILKSVMSSVAEAELGALFDNARLAVEFRLMLNEMGHPQPPTSIQTDNTTASGISNGTLKVRRSRAIDMRFHWLCDRSLQRHFTIVWAPKTYNLADYL